MALATFHRGSAQRTRILAAAGIAGAAVLGTPMAWAAMTDAEQLDACVTRGGTIRIIDVDAGGQCGKTEVPVTLATGAASLPDGSVRGGDGGVIADGTIDSFDIADGGIAPKDLGFDALTSSFKDELATIDGAANESTDLVSWFKVKDLTTGTGDDEDGVITGEYLEDGSVTSNDLADNSIGASKLDDLLLGRLAAIEADVLAVEDRMAELAEPLGFLHNQDKVHTTRLWGAKIDHVTAPFSDLSVPGEGQTSFTIGDLGIQQGDFLAVSPVGLPDGLVFGGAYVSGGDQVTVLVANYKTNPITLPSSSQWIVSSIDLT